MPVALAIGLIYESNMIVSLSTKNNFLGMELYLVASIVVTVFDVVYSFTQIFYNLVIKWDLSQMLEVIMYVFIDLYLFICRDMLHVFINKQVFAK